MATIDDKDLIDLIIKNSGSFESDPPVFQIVEYINSYGRTTWGVTWINEEERARRRYEYPSEYIRHPRIIWRNPNLREVYGV